MATLDQALAQAPNRAFLLCNLGRHEEAGKACRPFLGVASPVLLAAQAQRARARLHEIRGGGG